MKFKLIKSALTSFQGITKEPWKYSAVSNKKNTALKTFEQKLPTYTVYSLFNREKYEEAFSAFERATNIPVSTTWKEKAEYWKEENLFRLGNYQVSLQAYKAAHIASEKNLDYSLGYTYLKVNIIHKQPTPSKDSSPKPTTKH